MAKKPTRYPVSSTTNQLPPKKSHKSLTTILVIIGIVVIAALAIPIAMLVTFSVGCSNIDNKQQKRTEAQQAGLGSVTILNDQKTTTVGERNGDCLTGGDPSSVGASATFAKSSNVSDASTEIKQNMENQGYRQKESLMIGGSNDDARHSLFESYSKGSVSIGISYSLAQPYPCDTTIEPCGVDNVPPTEAIMHAVTNKIEVMYHDDSIQ